MTDRREAWLRGPIAGVSAMLQPVAHALVQAEEETRALLVEFDDRHLWMQPAGAASVGFHLQHLSGVIDRLTTYARGKPLNADQLEALSREGTGDPGTSSAALTAAFTSRVDDTLRWLATVDPSTLADARGVGRGQLPSTVIGLLVHAAEHTTRHLGQLIVTVRVVRTLPVRDA